ncbi:MAG: hypothetical protein A2798_01360 [Candidatus Levybacteria bacterium RIFCSPHIGHO2_01_FULL_37_17]|nr:MAG: hypothetical protein A2798_01360 [Candidatus Levybacteria bacterium RIFCSPHIGHO2_01_FULL_37_17]OGH37099.1 MAG: hypothetical protein A2959_02220 [Candidatus Levybacteria bacterium RIFCSPLOWO2_01_FULL_38_23]
MEEFKEVFNPVLNEFVDKKTAEFIKHTTDLFIKDFVTYSKNLITGGGKRIRPYLAYLSYKTFGGGNEDEEMDVFVALELFHNFLLIHDDIIDKSIVRRGQKTIHEYVLEKLSKDDRIGDLKHIANSQAIVIGDLIFSWVLELLIKSKNKSLSYLFNYFFKNVDEVIIGQIIDGDTSTRKRAGLKLIEEKTTLKTAYYSFIRPLQIGAVLANPNYGMEKLFEDFGTKLGIAFQIQDDLLDIIGKPDEIKKTPLLDIEEHRYTFFTNYLQENGTNEQQEYFNSVFGKKLTEPNQKLLRATFEKSGAITYGKKLINENFNKAKDIIRNSNLENDYKQNFIELVVLIEHRQS